MFNLGYTEEVAKDIRTSPAFRAASRPAIRGSAVDSKTVSARSMT